MAEKDRYYYIARLAVRLKKDQQVELFFASHWVTGKVVVPLDDGRNNYKYMSIKCDVPVNTNGYLDGFGVRINMDDLSDQKLRYQDNWIRKVD